MHRSVLALLFTSVLLLQKKDLRAGNADSFLSDIISKMNTGTDASG